MKNNIFQRLSSLILVLVIGFSLTGIASAADPFPWTTSPKFIGYLPNEVTSGVKVKSNIQVSAISGPTYKVAVTLSLENLPANSADKSYVYQAWLLDSETGYRLSIGSTIRKNNGTGYMSFTQYVSYPKIFDKLEVSKEQIFDLNPNPTENPVYRTDLNIPAFTELAYKTTLSSKNVVDPIANTNKGGTARFTINTKNNTLKYEFKLKNISATGRVIKIHGPARPGTIGPVVKILDTNTNNTFTGEWKYNDSIDEEKLINGEYYVQVYMSGAVSEIDLSRGQIVF
ncbi:CHRD domain-containing protein [Candidatus Falkowbacteria bacterium]|nr:MAG: CHRD domain-containing protein [Candidatus Falkowbacteria bacterium]